MPYTDSDAVQSTLDLMGVWMHDSLTNPAIIPVSNFPYGADARESTVDDMGEGTYYAGRTYPVYDYGEHKEYVVSVSIDVPHGPNYRADLARLLQFAESKRPIWLRDNRGRVIYGDISGYRNSDAAYGSVVSFTMTQAHRTYSTAVA